MRRRAWEREYRKKNRERLNAKSRKWHQKNRDKVIQRERELRSRPEAKAKAKAYRQRPEVKKRDGDRARKWREEHSEHYKEYHRKWYQQNREHLLRIGHDYHAKPEVKLRERKRTLLRKYGENGLRVFERDNFACQKCGAEEDVEVHHIDWNTANNALENLAVLCDKCHIKVHKFIPIAYRIIFFQMWLKNKVNGG